MDHYLLAYPTFVCAHFTQLVLATHPQTANSSCVVLQHLHHKVSAFLLCKPAHAPAAAKQPPKRAPQAHRAVTKTKLSAAHTGHRKGATQADYWPAPTWNVPPKRLFGRLP